MSNTYKIILFLTFSLFALCIGCKTDSSSSKPSDSKPAESEEEVISVPRFNRDSAYRFIEKQVAFGPRVPGNAEHIACKDWLVSQFKIYGAEVAEQTFKVEVPYRKDKVQAFNIIASFNPSAQKRLLLSAHWDTRYHGDQETRDELINLPILGADDGGSGVGILLEVGRILQQNPMNIGIDIVLFDVEDQGYDSRSRTADHSKTWCLGSQYWAKNLHIPNYKPKYGILLDMVGSKNARFPKELVSLEYAPHVVEKVWKKAQSLGYGNFFVNANSNAPVTDDHLFVNQIAKIPMIDIINKPERSRTGFGPYWHTHDDNMSVINKRTLRAVGQTVLAVIYAEK